jgi:CRP-like cAMP-binding protein
MFMIAHGYATVIIFNGATVALLSRGDYFGEVALLLPDNVRQATVRALTYCDLWVLSKDTFSAILHEFPLLATAMEDDLKAKNIDIHSLGLFKQSVRTFEPDVQQSQEKEPAARRLNRRTSGDATPNLDKRTSLLYGQRRISQNNVQHIADLEREIQFITKEINTLLHQRV